MSELHRAAEMSPAEEVWLAMSAVEYDLHGELGDHDSSETMLLDWQDGSGTHQRAISYVYAKSPSSDAGEYFPQFLKTDSNPEPDGPLIREGFQLWHDGRVWYLPPDGSEPQVGDETVERRMRAELEWFLDMKRQHRDRYTLHDRQHPAEN